jgi:uncharacterized protein (TIGR04255 family)
MTFPDSPRVIYKQNPLVEVICQLKFPPILKIESEPPAAFQEKIRKSYPMMQESSADQPLLPPGIARVIGQAVPGFFQGRTYSFVSEDERWKVTLTREFLALSTARYTRWEEFRSKLQVAVEALVSTYEPGFLVRVGLRYRDMIRRSMPGLGNLDWSKLLKPHILGELSQPRLSKAVQHSAHDVLISLDNSMGQVRVLHGLIREPGQTDFSYSIDSDFFYEGRTDLKDAFKYLDSFNRGRKTLPLVHYRRSPQAPGGFQTTLGHCFSGQNAVQPLSHGPSSRRGRLAHISSRSKRKKPKMLRSRSRLKSLLGYTATL